MRAPGDNFGQPADRPRFSTPKAPRAIVLRPSRAQNGDCHERGEAPHDRDQRDCYARGRAGRRPAGRALPRLPGVLVFLAPSAPRLGRSRLPRGRPGHARLWPHRCSRRNRQIHAAASGRRHGRLAGCLGRKNRGDRRSRLGRAGRLARGAAAPRPLSRRDRTERAVPAARLEPADHHDAAGRRRGVLSALFPGARRGRGGA